MTALLADEFTRSLTGGNYFPPPPQLQVRSSPSKKRQQPTSCSWAVGYKMAGGSESCFGPIEAVCEFIIFSNLLVLSDRPGYPVGSSSTRRLWRNSGQNPLERR